MDLTNHTSTTGPTITITDRETVKLVRWVASARADKRDAVRYFLHGIYVEGFSTILPDGPRFIATNGQRLHWAPMETSPLPTGIKDGCYSIEAESNKRVLLRLQTGWTFPNYRRVLPDVDHYTCEVVDATVGKTRFTPEGKALAHTKLIWAVMHTAQVTINIFYLTPMIGLTWNVRWNPKNTEQAVTFDCPGHHAVIMPMQQNRP